MRKARPLLLQIALSALFALSVNARAEEAAEAVSNSEDVPARTVFFELNAAEGASHYNLQVRPISQRWAEPMNSELNDTNIRLRLTPGHYELRTRSLDERGEPGRWSKWKSFWVQFRSPKNVIPADGAVLEPKANEDERVTFEWPEVAKSKSYIFTLFDAKGEQIRHARVQKTWIASNLKINSDYSWTIAPQTTREGEEEQAQDLPVHHFKIGTPQPLLRGIHVQVEPNPKAVSYDFEFVRFTSKNETSGSTIYNSKEPAYHVALAPGEYEMRVRSNEPNNKKSSWSSPQRFWVATFAPKQVSPSGGKKLDPTDDLDSEVTLKWEPAINAKHYHVSIWDDKGTLIKEANTDETQITVTLPHLNAYRWSVAAFQDREPTKKTAPSSDPALSSAFEIKKYKKLDMNSAEEPSQLYAWFRYINSAVNYSAQNYDNNTSTSQVMYGGEEEIAIGYWHRKTNLGILAASDASGFYTQHQMYGWLGGSLMLGYRVLDSNDRARWRFWAGMAYKETPEILTEFNFAQDSSHLVFRKTRALTPEVRASYVGEINSRYGYQIYAKFLETKNAIKTINDEALNYLYEFNLGLYGTYRFNNGWVGMLGYSYQVDAVSYGSNDPTVSGSNTSTFSGHYLSFVLELGLAKPSR